MPPELTISQVNKAGRILRQWQLTNPPRVASEEIMKAMAILLGFRAAHQYPLLKANMGLRSMVQTEGCRVEVSQRLKRVPTIIDKLMREPTMQLANMQDIGGCRAILANIDELGRVSRRLAKNRPGRIDNYVKNPRASGYRAIHHIVQYDGRKIEVQLRTGIMHEWAITVERLGGGLQTDLKSGRGPEPVLAWLEAISRAMALEERGEVVDTGLIEEIAVLRKAAIPHI